MVMLRIRTAQGEEPIELGGPGGTMRFGVGDPDGLRSTIWTVTAPRNKADVYVGNRSIMHQLKISLHESGDWRYQWTREQGATFLPAGVGRIIDQWAQPAEVGSGWTRAVRIWIAAEDLAVLGPPRGRPSSVQDIMWLPAPEPGEVFGFDVVIARAGQGVTRLLRYRPVDAMWLKASDESDDEDREFCVLLGARLSISPEERAWLDAERNRFIAAALRGGANLNSPTVRGALYAIDDGGARNLWDLSLTTTSR